MKIYEVKYDKVNREMAIEIVQREAYRFDNLDEANNYVDALHYVNDLHMDISFENITSRELAL
jgi:hypothetical protein